MRTLILCSLALVGACSDYGLTPDDKAEPRDHDDTAHPVEDSDADTDEADSGVPEVEDSDTPDTDEPDTDEPDTDEPDTDEATAGCADGEREGFLSWDDYPDIAACAGAWSEPGVTIDGQSPTCGNAAGDDSANAEGDGCSAADICETNWHVCEGASEVEDKAGSCDGAVPDGSPDKSLFFAVNQRSHNNSVCDDSAERGNDVFGCGNLGHTLSSDKDCGVLNRALASTSANSCGYNEAEPGHGPWECKGDDQSHYHEGELVTKKGCPGGSCSYDGYSVGSADKGGVLCCRDAG